MNRPDKRIDATHSSPIRRGLPLSVNEKDAIADVASHAGSSASHQKLILP